MEFYKRRDNQITVSGKLLFSNVIGLIIKRVGSNAIKLVDLSTLQNKVDPFIFASQAGQVYRFYKAFITVQLTTPPFKKEKETPICFNYIPDTRAYLRHEHLIRKCIGGGICESFLELKKSVNFCGFFYSTNSTENLIDFL